MTVRNTIDHRATFKPRFEVAWNLTEGIACSLQPLNVTVVKDDIPYTLQCEGVYERNGYLIIRFEVPYAQEPIFALDAKGDSITIECRVTFYYPATYTWFIYVVDN